MKNVLTLYVGTIVALTFACYTAYYLLLQDNFMHISISSIISNSHHLAGKKHLLVLGLLPIYIGTIVFGAALLGIYLGPAFQRFLNRADQKSDITS